MKVQNPNIKNRVRELRVTKGDLSQQELADLVGVSRQTIISIEKDRYSPSLALAFKVALALKSQIQDVFFIESI